MQSSLSLMHSMCFCSFVIAFSSFVSAGSVVRSYIVKGVRILKVSDMNKRKRKGIRI